MEVTALFRWTQKSKPWQWQYVTIPKLSDPLHLQYKLQSPLFHYLISISSPPSIPLSSSLETCDYLSKIKNIFTYEVTDQETFYCIIQYWLSRFYCIIQYWLNSTWAIQLQIRIWKPSPALANVTGKNSTPSASLDEQQYSASDLSHILTSNPLSKKQFASMAHGEKIIDWWAAIIGHCCIHYSKWMLLTCWYSSQVDAVHTTL